MQYGKERWVNGTALDVSATGFRCRTNSEIDPGSQIYIMADLDGQNISADAIAVHVDRIDDETWEAGFRFVQWHGSSKTAIEEFVSRLAQ